MIFEIMKYKSQHKIVLVVENDEILRLLFEYNNSIYILASYYNRIFKSYLKPAMTFDVSFNYIYFSDIINLIYKPIMKTTSIMESYKSMPQTTIKYLYRIDQDMINILISIIKEKMTEFVEMRNDLLRTILSTKLYDKIYNKDILLYEENILLTTLPDLEFVITFSSSIDNSKFLKYEVMKGNADLQATFIMFKLGTLNWEGQQLDVVKLSCLFKYDEINKFIVQNKVSKEPTKTRPYELENHGAFKIYVADAIQAITEEYSNLLKSNKSGDLLREDFNERSYYIKTHSLYSKTMTVLDYNIILNQVILPNVAKMNKLQEDIDAKLFKEKVVVSPSINEFDL